MSARTGWYSASRRRLPWPAGCCLAWAPALRGTRIDPASALKEGARSATGSSRFLDRALVAVQITLSLSLVTGAGLFTRSLQNLRNVDMGYERENILMVGVD